MNGPYVWSPGVGLYLPRDPDDPNFVPMALGETAYDVMGNFRPPTSSDFAAGLVSALNSVNADGGSLVKSWDPPVSMAVSALGTAVEVTAGKTIGALLSGVPDPYGVTSMVTNLANGDIVAAFEGVSLQAVDLALKAFDCVPVVGTICRGLLGFIFALIPKPPSYEEMIKDAIASMQGNLRVRCEGLVNDARYLSESTTGNSGNPDPADAFRPVAIAYQKSQPLPLCLASMYVALCGGVTEGFGWESEKQYQEFINVFSNYAPWCGTKTIPVIGKVPDCTVRSSSAPRGIPIETRRKMWAVIKGIMASVAKPSAELRDAPGDGGRALMPYLNETIRQEMLRGSFGPMKDDRSQLLSRAFFHGASNFIGSRYTKSATVSYGSKKVMARADCSAWNRYYETYPCPKSIDTCLMRGDKPAWHHYNFDMAPYVDLWTPFDASIRNWGAQLRTSFGWKNGQYDLSQIPAIPGKGVIPVKGSLAISKAAVAKLQSKVESVVKGTADAQMTAGKWAALGAGGLAAAYLGWTAVDAVVK